MSSPLRQPWWVQQIEVNYPFSTAPIYWSNTSSSTTPTSASDYPDNSSCGSPAPSRSPPVERKETIIVVLVRKCWDGWHCCQSDPDCQIWRKWLLSRNLSSISWRSFILYDYALGFAGCLSKAGALALKNNFAAFL